MTIQVKAFMILDPTLISTKIGQPKALGLQNKDGWGEMNQVGSNLLENVRVGLRKLKWSPPTFSSKVHLLLNIHLNMMGQSRTGIHKF